ncbi:MAG: hypothetical protein U0X73_07500 [Thermoanaerobaculia bacterium]
MSRAAGHPAACTIASNNYLAMARVLAESYREHHPGAPVVVCVVDRPSPEVDYAALPFEVVFAHELGMRRFAAVAFRYDVVELNTAVKPAFLRHLRDRRGLDRVLYFDPDILVLDTLRDVAAALDGASLLLTPHVTAPLDDEFRPSERALRLSGVYNLGFLGVRFGGATDRFLDWWEERLDRFCHDDLWHGLFVDQAWMDFAPSFLDDVRVLRQASLNVAYWNLAQRRIEKHGDRWHVGDRALGFFHFSGIDLSDLSQLSRHQDRIRLADRPELAPLLAEYRARVLAAGHESLRGIPYGFAHFEPGHIPIPSVLRRLLARVDPHGERFADPFDAAAPAGFFRWLSAPLDYPRGTLDRAALAIWEDRPELAARFPDPGLDDLPAFVDWLRADAAGARSADLPAPFLAPLAVADPPRDLPAPYVQQPYRPFANLTRVRDGELAAAVDLRSPGGLADWLIEPIVGRGGRRLPRWAMTLWEATPELARAFADPLGRDHAAFAGWLGREGALELAVHPDLVRALWEGLAESTRKAIATLAWRSPEALGFPPRAGLVRAVPAPAPRAPAPAPTPVTAESALDDLELGVNLLGHFREETLERRLADGTRAALAAAGIPTAVADLDLELSGRVLAGLAQLPEGAPHPIVLARVELRRMPWYLGWLPTAATAGGLRIGELAWEFAEFPRHAFPWLASWHEVWAPSRFSERALAAASPVAVRWVPPCVPAPELPASASPLDPERFWFATLFDARDELSLADPWAVLAALRRAAALCRRPLGLLLRVEGAVDAAHTASPVAELVDALVEAARGLAVEIHRTPIAPHLRAAPIAAADAYISLHRSAALGEEAIQALHLGKPVVATGYGGVTDFLAESTGYPVAFRLAPIGRNAGRLAGGAPWAEPDVEDAARRMVEIVSDPAAAAARARQGQVRVAALYGVAAAATRLRAELAAARARLAVARRAGAEPRP